MVCVTISLVYALLTQTSILTVFANYFFFIKAYASLILQNICKLCSILLQNNQYIDLASVCMLVILNIKELYKNITTLY